MLPYKSVLTRSFANEFGKLPRGVKTRILDTLKKAADSPYTGTELRGKLEGVWRLRIGKYRVVYMIDEKEKVIVFLDVGLRKSIYD